MDACERWRYTQALEDFGEGRQRKTAAKTDELSNYLTCNFCTACSCTVRVDRYPRQHFTTDTAVLKVALFDCAHTGKNNLSSTLVVQRRRLGEVRGDRKLGETRWHREDAASGASSVTTVTAREKEKLPSKRQEKHVISCHVRELTFVYFPAFSVRPRKNTCVFPRFLRPPFPISAFMQRSRAYTPKSYLRYEQHKLGALCVSGDELVHDCRCLVNSPDNLIQLLILLPQSSL